MSEGKNVRDTQFQGFAKALWDELEQAIRQDPGFIPEGKTGREKYIPVWQKIIARRAYDFACHLIKNGDPIDLDTSGEYGPVADEEAQRRVNNLPDLTELPKEQCDSVSIYESLCNDEGVMQVAIQITNALEPPRNYDNFGRIIAFSEGPEPPKEQEP